MPGTLRRTSWRLLIPCSLISRSLTVEIDCGMSCGRVVAVPVTSIGGMVVTGPGCGAESGVPAPTLETGASCACARPARIPATAMPTEASFPEGRSG